MNIYESSEQYQTMHETELDLIGAIRENTAALDSWRNNYELQQEQSKGLGASVLFSGSGSTAMGRTEEESRNGNWRRGGYYDDAGRWHSYAIGLSRVPYDNYPALLHQGERVLTAAQAREMDHDRARSVSDQAADSLAAGRTPADGYPSILHGEEPLLTAEPAGETGDGVTGGEAASSALDVPVMAGTAGDAAPISAAGALLPALGGWGGLAAEGRPARSGDGNRVIQVTVSGNTFGAGLDEAAVAEAIADAAARKILAGFHG